MKGINFRNIIIMIALCLVSLAWAEEKEEVREEPILLWQKTYEGIVDFSMSDDGSLIFLNEMKKTGNESITARYLVDSTGKVIRYSEGARAIISSDGTMIINLFNGVVEDLEGENITKIPFSFSTIEIPIFSPNDKYVVVAPGYEADYPFLRVYEVKSGQQLWKMQIEKETDITSFIILASFVTDESLAVFFNDKIILYDAKTGQRYWEKVIREIIEDKPSPTGFGYNELTTAENGDIVFFYRSKDALNKLTGKIFSLNANGKINWNITDMRIRMIEPSPKGNFLLVEKLTPVDKICLLDNNNGKVIWKKHFETPANEPHIFSDDEQYLILAGYSYDDEIEKPIMDNDTKLPLAKLYIINTVTKEILWSFPLNSSCGNRIQITLSETNNRLLVSDRRNVIYLFNVTPLWEAGK